MHREEQIVQAAAAALRASSGLAAAVLEHSTLSMSAPDQELPAVCINQGPDEELAEGGVTNLAYLDSLTTLTFSLYAQAPTQYDVAQELSRLRTEVHKVLLASPRTLGLSFVMGVFYRGATAVEYGEDGELLSGMRVCTFSFLYRMNIADPE